MLTDVVDVAVSILKYRSPIILSLFPNYRSLGFTCRDGIIVYDDQQNYLQGHDQVLG